MDDAEAAISYAELERRISVLPEGPVSALDTPRWLFMPNVIGTLGMIVGLLPSLLIQFFEPKMWMADLASVGVWMACLGYAPGFARSAYVAVRALWLWRSQQIAQLDHDFDQFSALQSWVACHSSESVAERLRFVQFAQQRMTMKLGMLAGGLDKLGVIPLVVALLIQLKVYADWDGVPLWQVLLGLFVAVTYLVAFVGSLMRSRLQLYETVLAEALHRKEGAR